MASKGLGSLTIQLIMGLGGFTAPLNKAERDLKRSTDRMSRQAYAFGNVIGRSLRTAATHLLAFTGATLSLGAAFGALKSAIDRADEIRDFSIKLGLSTEAVSVFGYAAKQTGTDMDTLSRSLIILSRNAALALNPKSKQAHLFETLLGDNYKKDINDLETLIPKLSDAFNKLGESTPKTGAFTQLLGARSGAELKEFFALGSAGFKEMEERARSLGIVISQDTADAADEFKDKVADLKAAFGGLATRVAAELLPALTSLVNSMIEFIKDGEGARKIAALLYAGFNTLLTVGQLVRDVFIALGKTMAAWAVEAVATYNIMVGFTQLDFSQMQRGFAQAKEGAAAFREAWKGGGTYGLQAPRAPTQIPGITVSPTAKTIAAAKELAAADAKLRALLANPTGAKGAKGNDDAKRAAEKLARAIEQMTKAQQAWQNELAKTGNPIADEYAERLRDITEQAKDFAKEGVPADKIKAFTDEMIRLATALKDADIATFQEEFAEETTALATSMAGPAVQATEAYRLAVKELDKQFADGLLNPALYKERLDALGQERDLSLNEVNNSILEQITLLGMTADQQEIYNNLIAAGVDAQSAMGQAIIHNTEKLQEMREQAQFMEGVKEGLSNMFVDFISGAKSAKEAFGDFADALFAAALKFVADKAINAMFKAFEKPAGATASGSSAGGWGGFLQAIMGWFGGGKAGGGYVQPGSFYKVNERGTEMLSVGGSDYLMMGQNAGHVTPSHAVGHMNQVNNFNFVGRVERRSQDQVESALAQRSRRAVMRNA